MPPRRKGPGRGSLPSVVVPLVSVFTDGRSKDRHDREVMRLLRLLRADGVSNYNIHHVRDGGLTKTLPLSLDGRVYDISFISDDGEVFLIELMRVTNLGKGRFNGNTGRFYDGTYRKDRPHVRPRTGLRREHDRQNKRWHGKTIDKTHGACRRLGSAPRRNKKLLQLRRAFQAPGQGT